MQAVTTYQPTLRGQRHSSLQIELEMPASYQQQLAAKRDRALTDLQDEASHERHLISREYQRYLQKCELYGIQSVSVDLWSSLYVTLEHRLTDMERQVLYLVMVGYNNSAIGTELTIGGDCVKFHMRNINKKLLLPIEDPRISRFTPRMVLIRLTGLCWQMLDRKMPV